MPASLPPNPSLEHLKKQAKALLRAVRRGESKAIERFDALPSESAPRLSDAQHLVAQEYGFQSWTQLKAHVVSRDRVTDEVMERARRAFQADDAAEVRRLLDRYPALKARINDPLGEFDAPPIIHARSRAMIDALTDAGADINARSRWWAGGFGLLDCVSPELAEYAIEQGAIVSVHAAARLGMIERLRALVEEQPERVRARGGDGQTPLHFASTVEVAAYLLDQGAEIDARDVDHKSTPAQYMVRTRQDVARYLIRRGCATDILMASALGDIELARKLLEADPECIRMRVSDEYFPMVGSDHGGTIYQWELGWYASAVQVARSFGHGDLFDLLMERSPADEVLVNACWLHDESLVRSTLAADPNVLSSLSPGLRRHVAHAARNNDTDAARLMLDAGLPSTGASSQHDATALHWAAWHGNAELVRRLLEEHPPLEDADNEFNSTPLGWAIHGSENGWDRRGGDYETTVQRLIEAGAQTPSTAGGTVAVQAILCRHGAR